MERELIEEMFAALEFARDELNRLTGGAGPEIHNALAKAADYLDKAD